MEILGAIKTYDWGKLGSSSTVAELAKLNDPNFVPKEDVPYSELWMGDHTSGFSLIKSSQENLGEFIQKNPQENAGGFSNLPYLFKVLSIRKALSIQVHPNKTEAERLHAEFPDIYKDPNHKPELAIALTEFHAMCGFRPYGEILQLLSEWQEIKDLIGVDKIDNLKSNTEESLKQCYSTLMKSSQEALDKCISAMKDKIVAKGGQKNKLDELFLMLNDDFPNDVGVLSMYFLNYLVLQPGDAIYLKANLPHAYIRGDCIECMACSDNVIRAGLTPKFKDVNTLLSMLDYSGEPAAKKLFQPKQLDENLRFTQTFLPDVKDFAVAKICVPKGEKSYKIVNRPNGCIILIISGDADLENGTKLTRGKIIFVPAAMGPTMNLKINDSGEEFLAFQAMYNDF